ncbi:MAG: hypothetical protein COB51_10755, partial [Moraxellaceae bacterium]
GLHLAKRIAQHLGGDIIVESEFGKGSTFIFSIATGPLNHIEDVARQERPTHQRALLPEGYNHAANTGFSDNGHGLSSEKKTI